MNEMALRHDWEAWRGHAHHARPWPAIVKFYQERIADGIPLQPLLQLVESVSQSSVANQIFAATSMSTLLISDTEDFRAGDGVLRVMYHPEKKSFEFHHRAFSGLHDKKICPEAEALPTLRLFLRLKYGILFETLST
jgi:hypothetical protein